MRAHCLMLILAGTLGLSAAAQASLVSLENVYSTGQGEAGSLDPNYILIGAPDTYPDFGSKYPNYPGVYIAYTNGYPFLGPAVPWVSYASLGAASQAGWIAPQQDYRDTLAGNEERRSDSEGIWQYQTSFYIQNGVDPTTALLYGAISSDNCTLAVLVNGVAVSGWAMQAGRCLADAHYFQIGGADASWTSDPDVHGGLDLRTAAFRPGDNTLTFVVRNNGPAPYPNPTGLLVWLEGEGELSPPSGVPEASTVALMLGGLGALAWICRRNLV